MARVSFVLRRDTSASGSYVRYPDGGDGGTLTARTDNDSFLRADGLQVAATAIGTSTFAATVVTYKSVTLDWSVPLSATAEATPTPTSLVIVYSKSGVPHTVASGKALVNTTSGVSTFIHDDSSTGESLTAGEWAYYSMFINYTSTGGDNFYTKVADLEVLIPVDYGSALTLWNQLPKFVRMQDIALGDYNYSADIGTTHGDKVGPLFKYLSIIGFDMDCMRTLIDYVMVSKDPTTANGETLDALADMMGIALRGSELGEARLRGILDNIGVYQRSKGTPAAIKQMIGGITGSNVTYSDSTRQYSIQSQRANYITVPKTGTGLTTWRESYPGESTAGTALNILRGAEFFIDAGRAVNAEQAALNQGTGGSALNARYGTGTGVDASDPLLLTHTGTNYMYVPGVNGNYVSIPDNPSLNITGDIELVARASPASWTPTTYCTLAQKNNIWYFRLSTAGKLEFVWNNGTAYQIKNTTQSIPIAAGVAAWVKTTFTVATGQARFYYATDQATEPSVWTELTAPSAFGATTMVAGAGVLGLGSNAGGTEPWVGGMYRFIVRNGIAGPTVVDVDFTTGLTSGNQVSVPFTGTALATSTPQYVSNLGTGGRALVARSGSTPSTGTDDPLLLTHTGENYLYMAGGAGGNASVSANIAAITDNGGAMDLSGTPGTMYLSLPGIAGHYASSTLNATSITGDIEIVVRVALANWTPASGGDRALVGKWTFSGQNGYAVSVAQNGAVNFHYSITGAEASPLAVQSDAVLPFTGSQIGWIKATRASSTGNVNFYYANDLGVSTEPTYTLLGSADRPGTSGSLFATSAPLNIGAYNNGNQAPAAGKFYRVAVKNGIGGPVVFDSFFTSAIMGSSTYVDTAGGATNGALVTLNGSLAKFVDGTTLFSQALPNDYTASAGSASFNSYCTIPDNAAFTPTTSISYRFAVAANNWTPDRDAYLGGHYASTANQRSSLCGFQPSSVGLPVMLLSPDGTGTAITTNGASAGLAYITANSTVAAALGSMTNGSPYVIRYDYVTTGTSASVSFFAKTTSASAGNADALSDTGWTAVGTPVTTNVPYVLFNSTANLTIGGLAGNPPVAGRHYAAVVKVDGVTQVNIDFTQQALYATSFTETSTNLATVTVTGGSNNDARIDRVRDVEAVCRVALDDWTCATTWSSQYLVGKGYGSEFFVMLAAANLQFYGSIGAATGNFIGLTWPLVSRPANGAAIWMKVTRNSTTGAIVFYTAPDSATEPTSWTTVSTNNNIIGNFKGNTRHPIAIGGGFNTGSTQASLPANGKFYRAIVRNGINGPAVADIDLTKSIALGSQTSVLTGGTTAQYATNLSTVSGASVLTARSGTIPSTDGADPVLLQWNGSNYWYQPSTQSSTNLVSTPSTTDISITGDISFAVEVQLDETIVDKSLLMKRENGVDGSLLSYNFKCFTAGGLGTLALTWTNAAGTGVFAYGVVAHGIQVGQKAWLGASLDVDNGAGGYTCRFYKSFDGINWTNYETQTTTSGTTDIRVNFAQVSIAGANAGAAGPAGKYFNAKIWSGLDFTATPVLNWSANDMGQNTGTSNGRVWTPVRSGSGRKGALVTRSTWIFGSSDFMEVQDNDLLDVTGTDSLTAIAIVRQWGVPTNYGRFLSKRNGAPKAGWELANNLTGYNILADISDGTSQATQSATYSPSQLSMFGMQLNRGSNSLRSFVNTTFSASVSTVAIGANTLANGFPMRIGKRADNSGNQDFELVAVAIFKSVVSDANLTNIYNHYINGSYDATTILQGANFWIDAALSPPALAITRSTSDHKSVAVVRPTFLFGGNDYMEVADNDLLDFGATDSFTMLVAIRQWPTPLSFGTIAGKNSSTSTVAGYRLYNQLSTSQVVGSITDGTTTGYSGDGTFSIPAIGQLAVQGVVLNRTTQKYNDFINGTVSSSTGTTASVGSLANTLPFKIGALGTGGSNPDMELFGAAVFRRALTNTEVALINTHYQGTVTPESVALLSTAVFWIDPARSQQEMAINRSTSGKKAVAVTRPTWLFSSSYMEVADNALLQFGASADLTVTAIYRQWGTVGFSPVVSRRSNAGGQPSGWELDAGYTSTGTIGSTSNFVTGGYTAPTPGTLSSLTMTRSSAGLIGYINNTAATPVVTAGYYGDSNPSVAETVKIGARYTPASNNSDIELLAVAIFRRALTATEIAAINTYYGTV